jgi:rhodanese-related sulfurtransferase
MKYPVFLFWAFLFSSCTAQNAPKQIVAEEFQKGMIAGNIQLLDVRTAGEYQSGHLKNALLADWNNESQFKDRIQYLDKKKAVYVYCLSGARSSAAADWLQQQGYTHVVSLKGGINAWKQANKPIEGTSNIPQMTIEAYQAAVSGNETVLVDFGADWCPPCKKMDPVLEQLKTEKKGAFKFIRVDGGVHTNVMKAMNVEALPVFLIYKNGKIVWRKQGVVSLDELSSHL